MFKSWGFVARHIARERFCLLSSPHNSHSLQHNVIKTLKLLGFVNSVVIADELFVPDSVTNMSKPCVLFYMNGNIQRHIIWMLYKLFQIQNCIVFLVSQCVTLVPDFLLRNMTCILWDKPQHTSIEYVAQNCPMINKFFRQLRRALLDQGPVLCIGNKNICCTLDFEVYTILKDVLFWQIIVGKQRQFRKNRVSAIVIQRAVKQWLYRPQSKWSHHIIQRLTLTASME